MRLLSLLLLAALVGCPSEVDDGDDDGDGFLPPEDCAPTNRFAFPGADDPYGDGLDANCDGADGVDDDGDGFAANADGLSVQHLRDCDDADPEVHPEAVDLVGDAVDNDCDGADGVDDDDDGWASVASGGRDCDDALLNVFPGAEDLVGDDRDQDCDGVDGTDADRDGWASADSWGTDCDDTDPAVHPGAFDACDGVDADCLEDPREVDADGDGFFVCAGDCDDDAPSVHPGAATQCDGLDRDCDGNADSVDADGDGTRGCDGDCDDGDPAVKPGAAEVCNLADDDCDGVLPAAERDGDGDGQVPCHGDCDDGAAAVFLGSWSEVAGDGVDTDCDGQDTAPTLAGASATIERGSTADRFGGAVTAGDVFGDGLGDLVIGAPGSSVVASGSAPQGRVRGFRALVGATSGYGAATPWPEEATLDGEAAFDGAGTSVVSGFDANGDGVHDVLIGAFGNNDGGQNAGKVYLFLGGGLAGFGTGAAAEYAWIGEGVDHEAGISVAAGDVDGDGLDDLVIGADGETTNGPWTGAVYIVLGASLGAPGGPARSLATADYVIRGTYAGHFMGTSVASGGDVDGDGTDDVLIGAPAADGSAPSGGLTYLFYGSALGPPGVRAAGSADVTLRGTVANRQMGETVALMDDIDGDGRAEVVVGSPTADSGAGRVALWYAAVLPASGTVDLGAAPVVFAGAAGHALGRGIGASDVDGDGLADLLLGAPGAASGRGAVGLWLATGLGPTGAHSILDADYAWTGPQGADAAGWSVSGAPDVNGDGRADVVVGSLREPGSATPGRAWLLLSPL